MIFYYISFLLIAAYSAEAYSKYGRTCKDIGCLDNEMCIMETDPCQYYQSGNDCGSYPTCKKMNDHSPPSCKNYVCPPTKMCHMDGATPKCVDDVGSGVVPLGNGGSHSSYPSYNPSAPDQPSAGLYPNIRGQTTTRSPMYRYPNTATGGGYQGGAVGSGYPGQQVQQAHGYPGQQPTGYPGYPSSGSGYPFQQQGGYPGQGYPQGGYQGGRYPTTGYPGYQGGYQNRYGYRSDGSSTLDRITNQLKTLGKNLLKNALG